MRLLEPRGSVDTVSVAVPPLTFAVPNSVDPLENVTLPLETAGDKVAVSVTGSPKVEELREDVKVVNVGPRAEPS